MTNIEAARKLYQQCKNMDIDETRELVLAAKEEDEIEFFSYLSDFVLQRKQREVIKQGRF